jgi:predicted nucleic-acid-binding Zn-ribbon protein
MKSCVNCKKIYFFEKNAPLKGKDKSSPLKIKKERYDVKKLVIK